MAMLRYNATEGNLVWRGRVARHPYLGKALRYYALANDRQSTQELCLGMGPNCYLVK